MVVLTLVGFVGFLLLIFGFLRNVHTDFQFTFVPAVSKCSSFPISCKSLLLCVVLIIAALTQVKWNVRAVSVCISLTVKILNTFSHFIHHLCFFFENCSIHLSIYWWNDLVFGVFNFCSNLWLGYANFIVEIFYPLG